jgi:hypothetical protein
MLTRSAASSELMPTARIPGKWLLHLQLKESPRPFCQINGLPRASSLSTAARRISTMTIWNTVDKGCNNAAFLPHLEPSTSSRTRPIDGRFSLGKHDRHCSKLCSRPWTKGNLRTSSCIMLGHWAFWPVKTAGVGFDCCCVHDFSAFFLFFFILLLWLTFESISSVSNDAKATTCSMVDA